MSLREKILNGTTGRSDIHCKIKETLLIRVLKPAFSENVGSEKLSLLAFYIFSRRLICLLLIISIVTFY